MTSRWLASGFAVLLVGCGSSPATQFYTLDAVPPQNAAQDRTASTPVQVVAVHIPPALDRQEIVRESAPHRVDVSDQHRWAGSLDTMIQRVLTQDLALRLPQSDVVLSQEPAPPHHDAIVVDILQFDEDAGGAIVFDGSWSLTDGTSGRPILSRHVRLSVPAGSADYAGQAAAMSQVIGQVAEQIAAAISPNGA